MSYLIVPVGATPPRQEGAITGMPFIKFVNDMEALFGFAIAIPTAWAAWNALRKTGRWQTANQARNDPDFQQEFKDLIQK